MKIYHNTRCKKSRAGLEFLQSKNIEHEVVLYLKDKPFTFDSLKKLLNKVDVKPFDMIRKQEADYKANYKGKEFSDDEWIKIMAENPKFINRPIIETENNAVWGDPPQNIETVL